MLKAIITATAIFTFAANVAAKGQTKYELLDHNIKKIEVQAYAVSMVNAAAFEMLCRETHSASFCTEMYKKAAKSAQGRVQKYSKEVLSRPSNVSTTSSPSKVLISDKWKDRNLWRHKLKRKLSPEQVRNIFGEPEKIVTIGHSDWWYYNYPSAKINFRNEQVSDWSEPNFN